LIASDPGYGRTVSTTLEGSAAEKEATAPDPDDPRKPKSPPDLHKRSWLFTAKMAFAEYKRDQCSDQAAALTFYAVAAVFPAFIVLAALVGLIGQSQRTADALLGLIDDLGQHDAADQLRGPITALAESRGAGVALIVGTLAALWSASAYVGAFGRAMNRVYEVDEGRPVWKLRPLNILVSLVLIVGAAALLLSVALSGRMAEEINSRLGLPHATLSAWTYAKWPLMLIVVAVLVAVLYYATPNVQQPRFRWMSVGAMLAIALWIVGSIGFGLYVQSFGSYDRTYGSLGGTIVILLWLWLTNAALLFGAEFDAELERARELEAGIHAEEILQLPPRDTTMSDKAARALADDIAEGRALRLQTHPDQSEGGMSPMPERPAGRSLSAALLVGLAVVMGRSRAARLHGR
jgi:membrane protein